MLSGLFETAATCDPKAVVKADNAALGQNYRLVQNVKMYVKAIEEEVFRRSMQGQDVPGTKLVSKRANRTWKDGAENLLLAAFGPDAYEPPAVKSPAEMEKLGAAAKELVKQHAYTPQTGYTVALEDDKRPTVTVPKGSEVFAKALENMGAE